MWSREVRTESHKMHLLDDFLRSAGPVTFMGKWVRLWAPDENLNFGTVWVKLQSHTLYP